MKSTFPNFKNKHRHEPHFSAFVIDELNGMPENVILSYSDRLSRMIRRNIPMSSIHSDINYVGALISKSYISNDNNLMLVSMPPGSPLVATTSDLLIKNGAKRIVVMGSAGAISDKLTFGDVVICNKAIRDEGTSHHYIKPAKYAFPSRELTKNIKDISESMGIKYFIGPTWTIDAMFRETKKEILHYMKEKVYTVEMEAAALFAVAKSRNIDASAIFSISDVLYAHEWSNFHNDRSKGYKNLAKIAIGFKEL